MVNRVMRAKGEKERRQRRAWAKPLSIASGTRPNRGVIQEYKLRTNLLGVPEYEIDELIKMLYGRDPIQGVPPARVEVEKTLARLKELVPEMYYFALPENSHHRTIIFYNATKTCYIIAHTDKRRKITLTSMEYGDKDRALSQFYKDKTVWVRFEPMKE